ncbi:tRNA uridine-5-carboxymethylaminomethyl(34) synthesis GTPase MnmE [Geomobilimonas luticola]|uniref:tRNA modification GTPase MnmE n=1 Tax=Geomobilimonas luticola TaxID=1114878 RepID=A0ABS5S8S3_9BACT|nr:tRNA uridine-5-carboxymethylaminomethyl(34) synthesis GTPase MnmE [Geomobilimonas luticola]MBT0651776.1 tRNA uridine-5-carboxymethylaminomethyl(34) synthesis GTPase MnmE [Geomobilimonas luticola]
MYIKDTIAAISTPVGEGGIGIIRVSGDAAPQVATRLFRGTTDGGLQSHRFYYGELVEPGKGNVIDEVMLVLMRAPRSYTREDVLEIHCHGGSLVVQKVLDLVLMQGARLADPGEFTRRAFLNGRIDLIQAEAVIEVIRSKTETALALAQHQREGLLSQRIGLIKDEVVHALALLEAYIDFPEEDIPPADYDEIARRTESAASGIEALLAGFREGRVLREGVAVLLAGKPNVGKSSLLNTLLREKRAIVTAIPGTTRDIIEEVINIRGLPVRLLDTAGIRESVDLVEQEGVRRTLEKIPQADLVLFMVDVSRPFDSEDELLLDNLAGSRFILVKSKCDLPAVMELPSLLLDAPSVTISTLTGDGVDQLRQVVHDTFLRDGAVDSREYVAISHARQRDALVKGLEALDRFSRNLALAVTAEILAIDLRDALRAVGEVTGETTPDDILDLIFQRFCIGK